MNLGVRSIDKGAESITGKNLYAAKRAVSTADWRNSNSWRRMAGRSESWTVAKPLEHRWGERVWPDYPDVSLFYVSQALRTEVELLQEHQIPCLTAARAIDATRAGGEIDPFAAGINGPLQNPGILHEFGSGPTEGVANIFIDAPRII